MREVQLFMALCCLGTCGLMGSLWLIDWRRSFATSVVAANRRSGASAAVGAAVMASPMVPDRAGPAFTARAAPAHTARAAPALTARAAPALTANATAAKHRPATAPPKPSPRSTNSSPVHDQLPCTEVCSK